MKRLRRLWREKRRETLLGGVVLLLIVISLAINMGRLNKRVSRVAAGGKNLRAEVQEKQRQFQAAIDEEQKLRTPIQKLAGARLQFWQPCDGNPQQEVRRRIEQCAKGADLRLKTVGTMQTTKVAEGLNAYEINVTADVQLKELVVFLQRISQEKPRIFWKNLSISPDNNRAPNYLIMNGTLRILVLGVPEVAQKLWSE